MRLWGIVFVLFDVVLLTDCARGGILVIGQITVDYRNTDRDRLVKIG
ncbi:hypothetical protein NFI96_015887 [Prochilodus magdalenae]|nr:hypothetical protein NFI96_015887 [Prochilodus magdalenae]